jgi:two-component system, chemotaxis family, sensor kinase CheA
MDLSKYYKIFAQESDRYLEELDDLLSQVERDLKNPGLWTDIHGKFHSIKGMARALSLDKITDLSHRIENWCKQFQEGTTDPESEWIQLFFDARDVLTSLVLQKGDISSVRDRQRYDRLMSCFKNDPGKTDSAIDTHRKISAADDHKPAPINYVRVKYSLIEELLGLSQEILLVEKTLPPLSEEQISLGLKSWIDDYRSILKGLHFRLAQLRLMSFSDFAEVFSRAVRDIARESKKSIHWEVVGGEQEADITLLERLREPFMHIVRNAIAHGIESPESRQKLGKDPVGTIRMEALREHGSFIVKLSDDGKGIDRSKIHQYLKTRKGLTDQEIGGLSENEFFETILNPDFSSAKSLTDIAGRGIGMNLVAQTIEYLGGHMAIRSEPSKGTEFLFKLPVSLSILYALVFQVGGFTCAIPTAGLISIDRSKDILSGDASGWYDIRRLFGIEETTPADTSYALTIRHAGSTVPESIENRRMRFHVDRIIGNKPIMVMPVGELLSTAGIFSGVGIMETGEISILLDVGGFPEGAGYWKRSD